MLRSQDRSYTRLDTWLFLASVGLSLLALFSPAGWGMSVAASLRDTVFAPLVWLNAQAEHGRHTRTRLAVVTAERDSAAFAAQFVPALRAENVRLRELLGLRARLSTPWVPAEVLHQAQAMDGRVLLLDAGSERGINAFDPVITPEGLLGVVRSAGAGSSVVMTWAHPEFRVAAFTTDGRVHGIAQPAGGSDGAEAWLELRGVPYRDTIAVGSVVLSSGLGGVYPKGIPIGNVIGVVREQAGWERVYRVRPAANPSAASHVLVLTAPRATDLAAAFPSDSILAAMAADSAARQAVQDSLLRLRIADSVLRAYAEAEAARRAAQAAQAAPPARSAPSVRSTPPAPEGAP
ncbi:MAG: rod shape-determining protein MreC [Gemmatimonadota bacterium]|nr:rod shape-determining protein MreC [Gemmatimonadota bacterium]